MRTWIALVVVLVLGLVAWSNQSLTGEGTRSGEMTASGIVSLYNIAVSTLQLIGVMGGFVGILVLTLKAGRTLGEVLTEMRALASKVDDYIDRNDQEHQTIHRRIDRVQDEMRGRTER